MKHTIIFSAADAADIRELLSSEHPHRGMSMSARNMLAGLLDDGRVTDHPAKLEAHVGLHDPVTLMNPDDASDWYRMEIVMPEEADVENDRISICHPMCLAVLGRRVGSSVEWDTGHGVRHMKVAEVEKAGLMLA